MFRSVAARAGFPRRRKAMSGIGNLLWCLGGGFMMGLVWFIAGVVMFCTVIGIPWLVLGHAAWGLLCTVTVIGIPFAAQHWKLASLAIAPVGKTIVSKHVAKAARRGRWGNG
jgi:uncharacterized membrane protein YccF (DUF307 family)